MIRHVHCLARTTAIVLAMLSICFVWQASSGVAQAQEMSPENIMEYLIAQNPTWKRNQNGKDVTTLFKAGSQQSAFEQDLEKAGYECSSLDSYQGTPISICIIKVSSNLVCVKNLRLVASFDKAKALQNVYAHYDLTCL
jgi:hypothetical protein